MLKTAWEFVKGLFGGKGTLQIGKGNQAVSASSTGSHSPAVAAGRDVHFNLHLPPSDSDAEVFQELEKSMPDLLAELKELLAQDPLIRDIIVLNKKSLVYNWQKPHGRFSADEDPYIRQKVAILENHGLLTPLDSTGFAYRISEKLAKYLRKA